MMTNTGEARGIGVHVVNLGCKVNRVESDWLETAFVDAGAILVPEDRAQLIAINTCAVTGEAQAKTRKAVRRAAAQPQRPIVAVTGCTANLFPDELAAIGPNVAVLTAKLTLVDDALRLVARRAEQGCDPVGIYRTPETGTVPHDVFRAKRGIKIQDGCDNRCTYCIVWKARGRSRSTPMVDVEAQVCRVLDEGASQVVLSGVNLAKYDGGAQAPDLAALVERLVARGVPSLRIGSVEPPDVTEALADVMARHADVVCAHLHLPLQSGCDTVLARMGRTYTTDEFAATVGLLRSRLPGISLTTDVIAGFPAETDEEHAASLAFCERMGFSKMHVFRYSARPGTEAAEMTDQVAPETSRRRSEELRAAGERMRLSDAATRVGGVERVLIERIDAKGGAWGTTASYHEAYLPPVSHGQHGAGLLDVRLNGLLEGRAVLVGEDLNR